MPYLFAIRSVADIGNKTLKNIECRGSLRRLGIGSIKIIQNYASY
jgi:hypothetical protein